MNRPLQFSTFAVPLSGNKGSASMFLGLRDAFAAAGIDVHFNVFSYYPKRDAKIAAQMDNVSVHPGHPKNIFFQLLPMILLRRVLPFLVPARWKRHIRALQGSDAVLMIGGTTFSDSMLYKVPWNLVAALSGYWLGRRIIFLSQTIGPHKKLLNRLLARWTLRRAIAVHGRGRDSARWVLQLGIENSDYEPDLSFSMFVPEFDEIANQNECIHRFKQKMRESDRTLVGIAPNSIVFGKAKKIGKDYVDFLTNVARIVSEQGHLPVLIPHSYLEDVSKTHNNDRSLCLAIIERLPKDIDCYYIDADLSSRELRSLIGRLHLLVASRFHSMISSLAMGVPPITFGFGYQKYTEVLKEFNLEELYTSFEELDIDKFTEKFKMADQQRDEISERIRAAGKDIKLQSAKLPQIIIEALSDQKPAGGI